MSVILVPVGYLGTASHALRKFMSSALRLVILLIEPGGERSVTRYVVTVVCHSV